MKAIDIVEKFKDVKLKEKGLLSIVISEIFIDLFEEILEIGKVRKAVSDRAFISIVKEQNLKLESANRKLEKKYGYKVFKNDVFILFICDKLPNLKEYFKDYL